MNLKIGLEAKLVSVDRKIELENQRHDSVIEKYAQQRATILAMIELENSEDESQEDMFAAPQGPVRKVTANDLETEILLLLKTQNNWPHATLKEFLVRKGLGKSTDPQFGRRVHGTLMSLRHRGAVEQSAPGTWRLASQSAEVA